MTRKKGFRPTGEHIMIVLEATKGVGMRYSEVKRAMLEQGWDHTDYAVSANLKHLLEKGNIVYVNYRYGIPIERNGSAYLTIETIETEVKKD